MRCAALLVSWSLFWGAAFRKKINDLPDVICCCGCAKMSAQFNGRRPGPDGVEAPTPDPRNRDGGRVGSGIHCVPGMDRGSRQVGLAGARV